MCSLFKLSVENMSRPNIVSIDQLQHEIDEAERYLRSNLSFKVVNKPLINESKVTKPSPSPEIPSSSSKSLKNRYTDPIEREKLLQRLLNEHNMKKSSTPQSVTRNTQSPAEIPEEVSSNTSHLSELESPQKLNDTLFYASEITPAKRYPNSEDNQFYDPFDKLHQLPQDTNEVMDESRAEEEDESIENDSMNSNYQQSASSPQVSTRYGYKNLNKTIKSQPESQKDPQNTQGKKRYQKTKEELVQEAREEFRRQYTFQPNLITTTGKQSAERSSPYQSSTTATTTATTTTTNPRKRSSSVNRIEAMLKLHEQKLINREKQKKEVEKAQVDLFCTFKPEICPGTNEILQKKYNEDLYHEQLIQQEQYDEYDTSRLSRSHRKISDSTTRPKSAPPTRTKTVTQRLYHDAEKKKQKQQIIQKELNQVYKSEYPFHPSINPITNSIVKQVNGAEYRPIYERVGDVQRQIVINKQILTNSYEEEMKNSTPFRPKIDHYSEKLIQQKRLKQSEESKDGASEQERKERLSNEIFHPNEGSGGSSSRKEEDDDGKNHVENRLLDEGKKQVMRKYQLIASREQELANQIKTPKPCKGSQEILEQKNIGSENFLQRQNKFLEKTKEHLDDIRKENEYECNQWFKPTLTGQTTSILLTTRQNLLNETITERTKRLSYDDMQIIHQNKLKKEQEIYQKLCTFTPTIDPISKELANKTSLSELHHNYRGKRIKDRIKLQVDNKESQECSFTPKIIQSQKSYKKYLKSIGKLTSPGTQHHSPLTWNEYDCPLMEQHDNYSPHAQGHERDRILYDDNLEIWRPLGSINMAEPDKMARDIKLKLQEKEMKRQQELMIKEINELKECTFQPKINDYPPSQHGPHHRTKPVIVKGLGRHLELRNLLNKQKELELKRKKEAFTVRNVDKYRSSIDGLTIVQPFQLHQHTTRRSRAIMELEAEEENNLTFSPTTNDSKRREIARRIVSNI